MRKLLDQWPGITAGVLVGLTVDWYRLTDQVDRRTSLEIEAGKINNT